MRTILELIRVILLLSLLGALGWFIVGNIYRINEVTEVYSWFGAIAILILLFVLYRNKLQFSGWYKGEGRMKLSKIVTRTLVLSSILLFAMPFLLGFFMS
ncbi:hypothetical protein M3210_13445 [Oceanobacillus luteolus]|uniref:DUF3995 domain-containing protein n=1 Tax=Oceanobacillus luteolus TaxID=1274358 RepID=A0ABW4HUD0_9BACI|nr:hypothetical protein [Oceanobacillus luteolus]MCM3741274.1 hypothetical protein [Oceanobacillus luteolus]